MGPINADQSNQEMVDRMIAWGSLWSSNLIAAFRETPRHLFLDRVFQYQRKHDRWEEIITRDAGMEELRIIYSDRALITRLSPATRAEPETPISSSSQPSLMAQMLEDVKPSLGDRVLEIGAGTGYNAALLAHVVGPEHVVSIDVDREVLAEAWDHLRAYPERRVEVRHADGRYGCPERAPFDRIMVTAATPDLEPAWLEQLSPRGMLLAPLVLAPGLAFVVRGRVVDGGFEGGLTRAAYFMPLRAEGETGASDTAPLPTPDVLRKVKAPWAAWSERRRLRHSWHGFMQSLAFYAWLRGLTVSYNTLSDGRATYGVSDPDSLGVCWLGNRQWQIEGRAGYDLGLTLWRAFLDAGGPWPTEFRLRASAAAELKPGGHESYVRRGPRCWQVWELIEPRDRPTWI